MSRNFRWAAVLAAALMVQLLAAATTLAQTAPAVEDASPSVSAVEIKPESNLNTGDTAWMLTSSALVLMMTGPALALFYGGLVRRKNVLSVMMQCIILIAIVSVLWAIV